jgi:hypothetical protein
VVHTPQLKGLQEQSLDTFGGGLCGLLTSVDDLLPWNSSDVPLSGYSHGLGKAMGLAGVMVCKLFLLDDPLPGLRGTTGVLADGLEIEYNCHVFFCYLSPYCDNMYRDFIDLFSESDKPKYSVIFEVAEHDGVIEAVELT